MQRRQGVFAFVLLCFGFLLWAASLSAQVNTATLSGAITDPQGLAVRGAKVTVTNVAKGTVEETTTNETGNYTVTHLIPDLYNVRIEATGFKVFEVKNIQISADASAREDAALRDPPDPNIGAPCNSDSIPSNLERQKYEKNFSFRIGRIRPDRYGASPI